MTQKKSFWRTIALILILISGAATTPDALAQGKRVVSGRVLDQDQQPIVGAAVVVSGTTQGTVTDIDGNYRIEVSNEAKELSFSYLGYTGQTVTIDGGTINVTLEDEFAELSDVVVIGYGTSKKGDLTGSISNVTSDDFNLGLISSPEQLINGKVSGVQIMSNSGSPSAGSTIRIRGGASLNASNDPLIVLDGVPLENGGISGNSSNFLSLINPSDIESMTVLKDASSTAIYGSRASNGVILITTKKGSKDKFNLSFSTTHSLQAKTKLADMLSRDEFIDVVNEDGRYTSLLGDEDTNWNNEVFRLAYGTDNNLSISAKTKIMPIRFSAGFYHQNGILDTDQAQRFSGSLNLSPTFFKDDLKVTLGVKGSVNKNRFAPTSAIYAAARYNPTIAVKSGDEAYGGYTEALSSGVPENGAIFNPVGLLQQTEDKSTVGRLIGNLDLDYKLRVLPELRAHITLAYDYAKGEGTVYVSPEAAEYYVDGVSGGRDYAYGPEKQYNKLFTGYLNYNKDFGTQRLDVTAGYDYQWWKTATPYYETTDCAGNVLSSIAATDSRHVLLSYYGRVNYTLKDKYMLTATVRRDGTSRFSKDNRWGTFPSVALAWRLSEEAFLSDIEALSNLKIRVSYGVTGQQDGIGNYNYMPLYTESQAGADYMFGGQAITTLRPEAYVADLKWETTKAWNFGLDFGFVNNRINGSFDYYTRKTEDLLATVPSAAGTNFDKSILTNVGNVDSQGLEFNINLAAIDTQDWGWDIGFNMTWQKQTVKNLSLVEGGETTSTQIGPTLDSYYFQRLTEGMAPYIFYLYHQLYDENGTPIEGLYADMDGDGEADMYYSKTPTPDYIMGFTTSLRFKKLTLGTSLRANIGNYVYNGTSMNNGATGTFSWASSQVLNLSRSYLTTRFTDRQYLSDYYLENASFLKMDNVTLNYNFGRIANLFNLNATFMVQNVFTVTKYTGVDPEVPDGMDSSFYPRPRTFSLSLGIDF